MTVLRRQPTISQPKDGCLTTLTCKVYQSVRLSKEPCPCGRNKQKQSSRRSAWYTQQSWCHVLCAAAPGIRWSNPRSFRQHLQPPSGYHIFGHIESGTLCGFSLERRHSGNINSSFPQAPKRDAKTKLGNTDPMDLPCDWRLTQSSCNYKKRKETKLENGTPQLSICSIGPPSNLAENMATRVPSPVGIVSPASAISPCPVAAWMDLVSCF